MEHELVLLEEWRKEDLKIVFTNGCFDLIHPGHLKLLKDARQMGDKLIVGLNDDESVSNLKGSKRPIIPFSQRKEILESIKWVDLVLSFSEPTPLSLIKKIIPHILVKGGDYKIENIVGSKFVIANGGEVKTVSFVEDYSSTKIIKKIKGL